jgi:beta-lactamase class A
MVMPRETIRIPVVCALALTAATASGLAAGTARAATSRVTQAGASRAAEGMCTAPRAHARLAGRLSRDIRRAIAGREGTIAVTMDDRRTHVVCRWNEGHRFDSASVVKTLILASLLRWHQEAHESLSPADKSLAFAMITQSDNAAASALWAQVGHARIQHFLRLAHMTETEPDPDGYWGLTQITARDELTLLRLLTHRNRVLSSSSRRYELSLMSQVIPAQRWGVPAGAPADVTVHVKNGWLPRATLGWRVHSTGTFNGHGRDYMIVVLTDGDPTMGYGVDTIQRIAEVIHRDLNSGHRRTRTIAPMVLPMVKQIPDEILPLLPAIP